MLGFCVTQSTMKGVLRQIHGKKPYNSIAFEASQCANLPPNPRVEFRRCASSDLTRAYPQDRRRPAKTASLAYDPCARDHCGVHDGTSAAGGRYHSRACALITEHPPHVLAIAETYRPGRPYGIAVRSWNDMEDAAACHPNPCCAKEL